MRIMEDVADAVTVYGQGACGAFTRRKDSTPQSAPPAYGRYPAPLPPLESKPPCPLPPPGRPWKSNPVSFQQPGSHPICRRSNRHRRGRRALQGRPCKRQAGQEEYFHTGAVQLSSTPLSNKTRAATPVFSCISPTRMCSVPTYPCRRRFAVFSASKR